VLKGLALAISRPVALALAVVARTPAHLVVV